jgi:solute carrier family 35 (GDP-fucose transporter), member C1
MCGFGTGMLTDLRGLLTSTRGIVLGVGSSFTTAVESVVVKRFMSKGDESMWQLVWMSSLMQIGLYIPLLYLAGELDVLAAQTPEVWAQFVKTAITTGMAGFLLTLATFLQISVTSPTTHMIVTAVRGVAQSALAVLIFGDKVTAGRLLGMSCILGGSMIYGWSKAQLKKQDHDGKGAHQPVPQVDVEMAEKESENK